MYIYPETKLKSSLDYVWCSKQPIRDDLVRTTNMRKSTTPIAVAAQERKRQQTIRPAHQQTRTPVTLASMAAQYQTNEMRYHDTSELLEMQTDVRPMKWQGGQVNHSNESTPSEPPTTITGQPYVAASKV
eukprot:IDg15734t1